MNNLFAFFILLSNMLALRSDIYMSDIYVCNHIEIKNTELPYNAKGKFYNGFEQLNTKYMLTYKQMCSARIPTKLDVDTESIIAFTQGVKGGRNWFPIFDCSEVSEYFLYDKTPDHYMSYNDINVTLRINPQTKGVVYVGFKTNGSLHNENMVDNLQRVEAYYDVSGTEAFYNKEFIQPLRYTEEVVKKLEFPIQKENGKWEDKYETLEKTFLLTERECNIAAHNINKNEKPVAFRKQSWAFHGFEPLYDRKEVLQDKVLSAPLPQHYMTKQTYLKELQNRYTKEMKFVGVIFQEMNWERKYHGETFVAYYDVSSVPRFKAWRLEQLFK
jgi:hypothetical protein